MNYTLDIAVIEDEDLVDQDKIDMSIDALRVDVMRINAATDLSQDEKDGMLAANDEATQGLQKELIANYPVVTYTEVEV